MQTDAVAQLRHDGVVLAYEERGTGAPPIVLVHGVACHRGFWSFQLEHFSQRHRVLAVDLRGHGASDAPEQRYTIKGFADDIVWMCAQLGMARPIVVGHSLGGLVALELAASYPEQLRAAVLVDSVLLPPGDHARVVRELVAALRSPEAEQVLRDYFAQFFGADDDPRRMAWILEEAKRTPPHVTSSVWEESVRVWDDADALAHCVAPLLYLNAGTPNADLERAAQLQPGLLMGRTIGSGHFSPLEVPEQVNAMLDRFVTTLGRG